MRALIWLRAQNAIHVLAYRLSRGRVGRVIFGAPVLVLYQVGRRTGRRHATPLLFGREGDDFLLVASYGGRPWHPAWYLNLKAHPEAEVELMGRRIPVRAEEIGSGEERDRLWRMMAALYPGYDTYQRKTERLIPVIRLRPRKA